MILQHNSKHGLKAKKKQHNNSKNTGSQSNDANHQGNHVIEHSNNNVKHTAKGTLSRKKRQHKKNTNQNRKHNYSLKIKNDHRSKPQTTDINNTDINILSQEYLSQRIYNALINKRIAYKFSRSVINECELLMHNYQIKHSSFNTTKRINLKHLPFITIDGIDARDFDDAVCCYMLDENTYKLYVAIADVAQFVVMDKKIDLEAKKRGTSIYFPSFAIPMLPHQLSNDLCSLKPDCERFVLVCEMQINATSGLLNHASIYHATIVSKMRFTYELAQEVLDDKHNLNMPNTEKEQITGNLTQLYNLYLVLNQAKISRHAIDFNMTETRFSFNQDNTLTGIVKKERLTTHRIIEECMLSANNAVAMILCHKQAKTLFRIHPIPSKEKVQTLEKYLNSIGVRFEYDKHELIPEDYTRLLHTIDSRQDFDIIQKMILRSMQLAVYSPKNCGHFGLNYQYYLHFTSPIRRYPDLLVHRLIKQIIDKNAGRVCIDKSIILQLNKLQNSKNSINTKLSDEFTEQQDHKLKNQKLKGQKNNISSQQNNNKNDYLLKLGEKLSFLERRTEKLAREVDDLYKCCFAKCHLLNQSLQGAINSVTDYGLFITIIEYDIEGLLHISKLSKSKHGEYFYVDTDNMLLKGKSSGRKFILGQSITVMIESINLTTCKIDFQLIDNKL